MLPPYIGSTYEAKALSGLYFGSVGSRKWKDIFYSEIKNNSHLFSIEILSYHNSHDSAIAEELRLQILYDVVKSPLFF